MSRGARIELEPNEVQLIMQTLFDSDTDEAAILHDHLVGFADRLNPDFAWTITVFRTDGENMS